MVAATCIGIVIRTIIIFKTSAQGERKLHNEMINRIVRAPINLYFDVTPVGRIVNRFSRDLGTVQDHFSGVTSGFIGIAFALIQSGFTTLYAVPIVILSYPFIFALLYRTFRYYAPVLREASRVECIAHSPIGSHITETINGASTIRAFKKSDSFLKQYYQMQDKANVTSIWEHGCHVSLVIKLQLIGLIIVTVTFIAAIFSKGVVGPITLSLLVFKINGFGDQACHFLFMMGEVEKSMVKVDRCLKVTEIAQENFNGRIP